MKKYIPSKMIHNSRFQEYFSALDEIERQKTLVIFNRLLDENREYEDNKNYNHLCNLLTSLALVLMLEENGHTRQESEKIVANAMYEYIRPQIKSMEKLASHSWFVKMLKISMPIKFRFTLGYGWNVEFPKASKKEFSMVTHQCIYQQIFTKYGMPEMTAYFCQVDDMLYSNLPRAEFIYTEQIGRGGRFCDYTYRKR